MDGVGAMAERRDLAHVPVLREEAVTALAVRPDGCYLDGTFGRGGHARAILDHLDANGRLLLLDRDPDAIAEAQRSFAGDPRVAIRHANFAELGEWNETHAGLEGVLLDLGVSSPQLDATARGFSFLADAPLDMRMDTSRGASVADFLAGAPARDIADVLWRYGDERMNRRIARAIVARREQAPILTTRELAELLERTLGRRERNKHPATRSFQALRIHINDELGSLERGLRAATDALKPGGRLVVISFHSLEDRIVKHYIRGEQPVRTRRGLPPPQAGSSPLRAIGRAQFPSQAEIARNPRARSAVLRVAERIDSERMA